MGIANVIVGTSNVICAVVAILLAIPLLRGKVKRNILYGARFKESFESEEAWYRINRFGARRMIQWSVLLLAIGVASFFIPMNDSFARIFPLSMAPMVYVIAAWQTHRYARGV